MKLILSALCFIMLLSTSCSSDDDNNLNTIEYRVYSNTPNQPVQVQAGYVGIFTIKDEWIREFTTEEKHPYLEISCHDSETLLIAEIYLDGKLVKVKDGNGWVRIQYDIK